MHSPSLLVLGLLAFAVFAVDPTEVPEEPDKLLRQLSYLDNGFEVEKEVCAYFDIEKSSVYVKGDKVIVANSLDAVKSQNCNRAYESKRWHYTCNEDAKIMSGSSSVFNAKEFYLHAQFSEKERENPIVLGLESSGMCYIGGVDVSCASVDDSFCPMKAISNNQMLSLPLFNYGGKALSGCTSGSNNAYSCTVDGATIPVKSFYMGSSTFFFKVNNHFCVPVDVKLEIDTGLTAAASRITVAPCYSNYDTTTNSESTFDGSIFSHIGEEEAVRYHIVKTCKPSGNSKFTCDSHRYDSYVHDAKRNFMVNCSLHSENNECSRYEYDSEIDYYQIGNDVLYYNKESSQSQSPILASANDCQFTFANYPQVVANFDFLPRHKKGSEYYSERQFESTQHFSRHGIEHTLYLNLVCEGTTVKKHQDPESSGTIGYSYRHYICRDNGYSYLKKGRVKEFFVNHWLQGTNFPLLNREFDAFYDGKSYHLREEGQFYSWQYDPRIGSGNGALRRGSAAVAVLALLLLLL